MTWRLDKWCDYYARLTGKELIPMTKDEINAAQTYLRESHYEKPEDCPENKCPKYRPACSMDICQIATGLCGDF
jgi:hypothetical protein